MTPSQVAKLIGCHPGTIRQRIREGTLRATRSPVRNGRWVVHRDSLIRWLLSAGWGSREIRKVCPMPGPLFTVGLRKSLIRSWSRDERLDYPSMFAAGVSIAALQPWGVLFDLDTLGAAVTMEDLSTYHPQVDRPALIALHADDFVDRDGVFDAAIPGSLPLSKIIQRVRALQPW